MGILGGAGGFYGTHPPGLKIPLRALCFLSRASERKGPPGLRGKRPARLRAKLIPFNKADFHLNITFFMLY